MENTIFCDIYRECFGGSFGKYSHLKNERLFVVRPTYTERWMYIDTVPFIESFNVEKQEYQLIKYESI